MTNAGAAVTGKKISLIFDLYSCQFTEKDEQFCGSLFLEEGSCIAAGVLLQLCLFTPMPCEATGKAAGRSWRNLIARYYINGEW